MDKRSAFAPIKVACFTVFCLMLGLIDPLLGQPLQGSGTATIDGTLDSGEWTNAGTVDLTVKLPAGEGGGTTTGKLYVMNDSSTLYLAIKVDRNLKDVSSVFALFQFDNDNDGVLEAGDDFLQTGFSPGAPPLLVDKVLTGPDSSADDINRGGTDDINGAVSLDGTYSFLEISHPLNSADDANDFSLTSGQVVGFKLAFQIWQGGGATTPYPPGGTVEFAQIQVSGTTPGPEPLNEKLAFPQFGVGTGLTSQIVLTNPSQLHSATAQVQITDDQGAPVAVGFNGVGASGSVSIPPLGSVTLTGINPGKLTVGSAVVSASRLIGGTIRFEISGIGIAGVGASTPVPAFITPVRRTAGSINTGVAIQNLGTTATRLEFSLQAENGQVVAEGSYVIESFPAGGHLAKFVDELFGQAQLDSFKGTLVVRSIGAPIGAVALELGGKPGEFTTLPVVPLMD
jgi:hypothetical protein